MLAISKNIAVKWSEESSLHGSAWKCLRQTKDASWVEERCQHCQAIVERFQFIQAELNFTRSER